MKRVLIALVFAFCFIAGCVPTLYQWSFDGKWMTVQSKGVLHVTDADGTLTRTEIPDVTLARWFPESDRVLVAKDHVEPNRDGLAAYLTPQETQTVKSFAADLKVFVYTYDWSKSDPTWNGLWGNFVKQEVADGRDINAVSHCDVATGIYLRDHADADLKEKIPAEQWNELLGVSATVHDIQWYGANAFGATPGNTIMHCLLDVVELRVNSTANAALILLKGPKGDNAQLWLAPIDGSSPPQLLSDAVAWFPDWSRDGKKVLYARQDSKDSDNSPSLGSIISEPVIGEDGKIMSNPSASESLASILFSPMTRIRCMQNDQILFASPEVSLPSKPNDQKDHYHLYSIDPASDGTPVRLISNEIEQKGGDMAPFFEPNADGTLLSIPDQTGRVSVYNLTTHQIIWVQDKPVATPGHDGALVTVPTWRGSDELTMMAPRVDGKPMVVGYSMSGRSARHLSKDWREGIILLPDASSGEISSNATQPSTRH